LSFIVLDLNGGSGDDTFVVRSFVNLPIAGNGTILPADVAGVRCFGGDDDDAFDVNSRLLENATDVTIEDFDVKEDDPDYLINSLVDVDGGTGTDHLVVVGTEFDDSYVVTGKCFASNRIHPVWMRTPAQSVLFLLYRTRRLRRRTNDQVREY
jgi:hypothetical protein